MQLVLFVLFGLFAVLGGLIVVGNRNPIYSALGLVVALFSISALYVILGAYFVAAVQVIVYAGAIVVLFLFVIMLLNLNDRERLREQFTLRSVIGIVLGLVFVAVTGLTVWAVVHPGTGAAMPLSDVGHTKQVGRLLFSNYLLPFEVTSVILLAGMVGVLVLIRFHGRGHRS
ncbi:MAG: NADH dehydrogenase subunit J [Candidatus Poribacteria bacterium]|nr:MAG: NADH dehydrogenase subunit J [Candidatus Poribacteria bacterium]